jgi:hypothetical protein
MGYPSWSKLSELTYEEIKRLNRVSDINSYEKYLQDKKYPELFSLAERDLGSSTALIDIIKSLLQPHDKKQSVLYDIISKWPFACYLTTNYDDEIATHLSKLKEYYTVMRNRKEDFSYLRDGASHIIQKLHSDLNYPSEIILTSTDYKRFSVDYEGQYFRDKLRQIFEIFDVFIVGHSLSDPDINLILQIAKETANPLHPIYMVAADFTKADEQEFFEKYNIVLVQYSNNDGTHSELRRMFKIADRFIVPRHHLRERAEIVAPPKEEADAAVALFLYRRLQGVNATDYLCPLILSGLFSADDKGIPKESINSIPMLRMIDIGQKNFQEAISTGIEQLIQQNLVEDINDNIKITNNGRENVLESQSIRETEKNQAFGQFRIILKDNYEGLTDTQFELCKNLAEETIKTSFSSRGLAISNQVYSNQPARPGELSDIFGGISDIATGISNMELRAVFFEAMYQFLIEPNPPQRKYLASVSQGFFLFHLLGLDPTCSKIRQNIFQRTIWICDSSIILPLVAIGCHNHEYAVELFKMLSGASAFVFTTPNFIKEVWAHFEWALQFIKDYGTDSPDFLRAALVKGSYKQNLFLDGYIRLSADGGIATFKDYLNMSLSNGGLSLSSLSNIIAKAGIKSINISDLNGFSQNDWGEIEEAKLKIQNEREKRGTYRSPLQVEAEAEVWILVKNLVGRKYTFDDPHIPERVYFVSQSRIMDHAFPLEAVTTWAPGALYRYLSALPGNELSSDLLQQSMLQEYYYAGISFIDSESYSRFFGPSIDAAKLSFEREKSNYISELEETRTKDIDDAFSKTPDLEKPFFVAQMGWRMAEKAKKREELARRDAFEAEAKAKKLESEKNKAWKTREKDRQEQKEAELRNIRDPKHIRKRKRQAKKRKKKKK